MQLETTRFGTIEVDETRAIHFPKGLLGFSRFKDYVLIEPNDDGYFWSRAEHRVVSQFEIRRNNAPNVGFSADHLCNYAQRRTLAHGHRHFCS